MGSEDRIIDRRSDRAGIAAMRIVTNRIFTHTALSSTALSVPQILKPIRDFSLWCPRHLNSLQLSNDLRLSGPRHINFNLPRSVQHPSASTHCL